MIAKLQENQKAIPNKLGDQEAAMTQALLTQQQQLLPLLQTPQQPELTTAAETSATAPTTIDPDAGLDLDLPREMGNKPISSLVNSSLDELEALDSKNLTDKRRSTTLSQRKRRKI